MQQVAKPRMSTTKVYDALSRKMDRQTAQLLIDYLEEKIPADVQDSIKYLATKEDVALVKAEIAKTETKLTEKINGVETQVAHVKGELREEIVNVKGELTATILQVKEKMEEGLKVQTRWMMGALFSLIGLIITIIGLIVTLYIKK